MNAGGMWALLRVLAPRVLKAFFENAGTHLAASIAFRVLFSLFPLAIVLAAVFSLVADTLDVRTDVVDALVRQMPLTEEGRSSLRRLLEQSIEGMGTVGILGLVGLVWAASGMMSAVRTALNRAWEVDDARPWLVGKAVDVLLVFGVAVVVATSVALNVTVRLAQRVVDWIGIGTTLAQVALGVLAPFVLVLLVAATAYRLVPAAESQLRDVVPAAALVAAVFTAGQFLFSLYLDHFGRYNAIYGSFGAVIALMFFVYLVSLVFLVGAHVAALAPDARMEVVRRGADDESQSVPFSVRMKHALRGLVFRETTRRHRPP